METPQITPEDLHRWDACYSDRRIANLFAGRKSVALSTILRCDRVPAKDRVWVAYQAARSERLLSGALHDLYWAARIAGIQEANRTVMLLTNRWHRVRDRATIAELLRAFRSR